MSTRNGDKNTRRIIMKFCAKGQWSWELNGSVSDKIKKILGKLKNIINKDENN